jgi:micrococcal nuclease
VQRPPEGIARGSGQIKLGGGYRRHQAQMLTGGVVPAKPTVCILPPPPDLDCGDISFRRFTVLPPDPHGFDGDNDPVGCES